MASLNFYAKPHPLCCRVRLRYTYNRDSRCDFYCGVEISDKGNFIPRNNFTPISKKEKDFEIKNTQLKLLKRNVEEVIQSLILLKKEPTAELVKERYKSHKFVLSNNTNIDSKINRYFVIKTIDEYIIHLENRVNVGDGMKKSSFEKSRRILEKWKEFFNKKKISSIQFEELRNKYNLLRDFAEWVIKEGKFANSSVNKYNMVFRGFMRWSKNMDYHNIDEKRFDSPKLKEVSNRSILALTPKQLFAIRDFTGFDYLDKNGEFNKEHLIYKKKEERYFYYEDRFIHKHWDSKGKLTETKFVKTYTTLEVVKDFFCFLCSTSLSYIDAANLKIKDVNIDKDLIEIVRIKTSTPLSIPLNETSRAIWRKYSKDKNFKRKDGKFIDTHYLFPRFEGSDKFLSNANTNSTLKRIGEVLQKDLSNMINIEVRSGSGIKEGTDEEVPLYTKLHTHMGRKTFITFALSEGISPLDIKRISGHSDEKMMKYYVNSLREEVVEKFQNMDAFMGKGKYIGPKNKKITAKKTEKLVIHNSVKDTLLELKGLLDAGLMNEKEFNEKRVEILNRL